MVHCVYSDIMLCSVQWIRWLKMAGNVLTVMATATTVSVTHTQTSVRLSGVLVCLSSLSLFTV